MSRQLHLDAEGLAHLAKHVPPENQVLLEKDDLQEVGAETPEANALTSTFASRKTLTNDSEDVLVREQALRFGERQGPVPELPETGHRDLAPQGLAGDLALRPALAAATLSRAFSSFGSSRIVRVVMVRSLL